MWDSEKFLCNCDEIDKSNHQPARGVFSNGKMTNHQKTYSVRTPRNMKTRLQYSIDLHYFSAKSPNNNNKMKKQGKKDEIYSIFKEQTSPNDFTTEQEVRTFSSKLSMHD